MPSMKSIVGIVALSLALVGCGVGVDDPEGAQAAGVHTQAVTAAASSNATVSGSTAVTTAGTTAAPQDPIPAFNPSPAVGVPLAGGSLAPGGGPLPGTP
jgi:hypothetical protein